MIDVSVNGKAFRLLERTPYIAYGDMSNFNLNVGEHGVINVDGYIVKLPKDCPLFYCHFKESVEDCLKSDCRQFEYPAFFVCRHPSYKSRWIACEHKSGTWIGGQTAPTRESAVLYAIESFRLSAREYLMSPLGDFPIINGEIAD